MHANKSYKCLKAACTSGSQSCRSDRRADLCDQAQRRLGAAAVPEEPKPVIEELSKCYITENDGKTLTILSGDESRSVPLAG